MTDVNPPSPALQQGKSRKAGWLLVLLLGAVAGVLAVYWPKISTKLNTRQEEASAIEELQQKVELLERRVSELSGTVYQAQQRAEEALAKQSESTGSVAGNTGVSAEYAQSLAMLEERLETLEGRRPAGEGGTDADPLPGRAAMLALQSRLDQIERQVSTGATNITEETGKVLEENARTRRSLVLAAAYDRVSAAIQSGASYAGVWTSFSTLAANDPVLSPLVESLGPYRNQGVATLPQLNEEFAAAVEAWETQRKALPENAGVVEKLKYNLTKLVSIRKVGEMQAGDEDEVRIARAEAKLKRGAALEAMSEIKQLSPSAFDLFKAWSRRAETHLLAKDALAKIQTVVWQASAPAPATAQGSR